MGIFDHRRELVGELGLLLLLMTGGEGRREEGRGGEGRGGEGGEGGEEDSYVFARSTSKT